jgi:hypothetical protein
MGKSGVEHMGQLPYLGDGFGDSLAKRRGGRNRVNYKTGLRDFSTLALALRLVSLPDPNEVVGTVLSLDVDIDRA